MDRANSAEHSAHTERVEQIERASHMASAIWMGSTAPIVSAGHTPNSGDTGGKALSGKQISSKRRSSTGSLIMGNAAGTGLRPVIVGDQIGLSVIEGRMVGQAVGGHHSMRSVAGGGVIGVVI